MAGSPKVSLRHQPHPTMGLSPQLSSVPFPRVPDDALQPPCKNVLFFGETGVGKSSVIAMLVGKDAGIPRLSNGASGCTSSCVPYRATIDGQRFNLWDTIGLNESERGSTHPLVAAKKLAELELAQDLSDGLHLLVYVIRGPRFREVVRFNYDFFHRVICEKRVPIVLVVTGLENEGSMKRWWDANETDLRRVGLVFQDHACITACHGGFKFGRPAYEEEYEMSKRMLRELVVKNCSGTPYVLGRWQERYDVEEIIGGSVEARTRSGNCQREGDGVSEYTSFFVDFIHRLWISLVLWWRGTHTNTTPFDQSLHPGP